MSNISYRVSEEIVRWTLEVFLDNAQTDWWTAFRNPTAGPWKTVTAPDMKGVYQEVYRFTRDEDRPDLIVVNDKVRRVLVIEAKDTFQRIGNEFQVEKLLRAVPTIEALLTQRSASVWRDRAGYLFWPAFLWHSRALESAVDEDTRIFRICEHLKADFQWLSRSTTISIVIVNERGTLRPIFFRGGSYSRSLDILSQ